jgi:transcriptional regulator with XRE-family HTH domain
LLKLDKGEKNMHKEKFLESLKSKRIAMGITQKEIAKNIGIERCTYTLWENGKREPDIESIGKLTKILKIDYNQLFGNEKR